jgi:hypothetical protein
MDRGDFTFERYQRLTRFLPAWVRCRLFGLLPRRLQQQAWAELERETGLSHIAPLVQDELERLRDER